MQTQTPFSTRSSSVVLSETLAVILSSLSDASVVLSETLAVILSSLSDASVVLSETLAVILSSSDAFEAFDILVDSSSLSS